MRRYFILLLLTACPLVVHAHGGRTNAQGCHNQTGGSFHCHNGGSAAPGPRYTTPRYEPPPSAREPERQSLSLLTRPAPNSYDSQLEIVQKMLIKLGYTLGQVDGILGESTKDAILAFQTDSQVEVTGVVTAELIDQLIDALAK